MLLMPIIGRNSETSSRLRLVYRFENNAGLFFLARLWFGWENPTAQVEDGQWTWDSSHLTDSNQDEVPAHYGTHQAKCTAGLQ